MTKLALPGGAALRAQASIPTLALTLLLATPAFAQDTTPVTQDPPAIGVSAQDTQTTAADDAIVVTGSRIRRPNLDSGAPITTVSGAEFFQTGKVSIGDILNELPQLTTTFSQQNSTRFLGTRGLNLLDLRNLGTQRTLVLVNGRRHVGADVLNSAVSPDTNSFPTDLIESVDISTGGGSTIYGSDAIAGVVNFKLKQDYEGLSLRAQSGISQYGDGRNQYVSALAGTNFAEGRGNIAVNVEYAHQGRYTASGRPLAQANGLVTVDADPAGSVNGSDGVPDRVFLRDIRSPTTNLGGTILFANPGGACGRSETGVPFLCSYFFQPSGRLTQQTGQRVGLAPNGSFIGGNGYSGRENELLTLSPRLNRVNANVLAHFDFSDAFKVFAEAKYARTVSQGSQSGPFFTNGTILGDTAPGNREQVRLDNPYLNSEDRAFLVSQLLPLTVNAQSGAAFTQRRDGDGNPIGLTPAQQLANQRAAISDGSYRLALRRGFLDFGIRDERIVRETYRAVLGARGDLGEHLNYEISANYGEHREKNRVISNVNVQRYLLASDTVRNAAGQIVCRSQVNPAAALGLLTDDQGNPRTVANDPRLAGDIAACVPLNPFGQGSTSQAVRDYLTVDSNASGKITQFVANGSIAGDFGQLFELPGGPVGFAIGGEYRRETVRYDLDELTQQGYAFYNAIPSFRAPSFEVKEVFGELRVPLLKDIPFFKELTVSGSARVSDYKGATGTVYAYAGEAIWKPIEDVTFRGSYNRAIRAPNLSELFSAQGQNFTPAPSDPCSDRNLASGTANRAANCAAAGRPAGYDFVYLQSLELVSGGNPNLREEKSDNYTAGIVLTPRMIPGLSFSVDYYNIKVKNVISSVDAQTILNNCYDAATLENPFCSSFQRAGAGGGPRGEAPFQILEGSLLVSSLNFAKLTARGIDADLSYRKTFDWGSLGFRANYTRVLNRDDFLDPSDPNFADRVAGEVGTPLDRLTANVDGRYGNFTLGYQVRWIGRQVFGQWENTNSVQGRPPENADYSSPRYYGNVFYHDIRAAVDVNDRFSFYGGVDNLLNRFGPFGTTGIGLGLDNTGQTGLYDNRGRYFYAGITAKF